MGADGTSPTNTWNYRTKRHKAIKHNFYNTSLDTIVLQSGFKYIHNLQIYNHRDPRLNKRKKGRHFTTSTLLPMHNRSDRSIQPVRPACMNPLHEYRSDRSNKNWGVALPSRKRATRRLPDLRVSIHHFPPLCISADKFDAAGAEINVGVPWNKLMVQQPWATNTQQNLPDQWV